MTMSAVYYDDPEEGRNVEIVYSIQKNVVEEETGLPILEIDSSTGAIRTAVCCLDSERTPDYVIQVVAVDGGGLKTFSALIALIEQKSGKEPFSSRTTN
ncbi:beta-catenin binding [Homalodisca vitripennis]|nr:beta-catenin binding [Homalodisca vitripennis]